MSFDVTQFKLTPGFRVIEAGAGSGKTFNLVKIVTRLAKGDGVAKDGDIRRVVLVTFTRSAALEMRQRARAELEQAGMTRALQQLGGMQISTIHSFCHRILRDYGPQAGFPRVADSVDAGGDQALNLAQDWWRAQARVATDKAIESGDMPARNLGLSEIIKATKWLLANPDSKLSPELEQSNLKAFIAKATAGAAGLSGLTHDDLIRTTHACLNEPGKRGDTFRALVKADFDACLVDEAQDTDSMQWGIFQRIFEPSDGKLLIMVGDPKQAIYGFRGADITSYLRARERAREKLGDEAIHQLSANFRSKENLIQAFNRLFKEHPKFFGESIRCELIDLPDPKTAKTNHEKCKRDQLKPPVRVVDVSKKDDEQVVREVAKLLTELTDKEKPADYAKTSIGVLVRGNLDAIRIHRTLVGRGIPTALAVKSSVFNSELAPPLQLLLRAILEPESTGVRKAALLARPSLLGMDGDINAAYAAHGEAMGDWLRGLRKTWNERGIGACWEQMATTSPEGLLPVRLALAKGALPQRYLADFNHLGELLSKLALENHLTMEALVDNFAQRIEGANPETEEDAEDEQVRAETASPQVIVRTIHSAKGLEYEGVVLALFDKEKDITKKHGGLLRIPGEVSRIITESSDDTDLKLLANQTIDEDARVLYVALTRARRRLVLLWESAEESAASDKLLSGFTIVLGRAGIGSTPESFVKTLGSELAEHAPKASDEDISEAMTRLVAPQAIAAELLTHPISEGQMAYRRSTSSFTRLTEKTVGSGLAGKKGEAKGRPFEAFIGGKRAKGAGTYLHRLLELIDFPKAANDPAYVREVAERELRQSGLFLGDKHGFEAQLGLVCDEVPLWLNRKTSSGFAFKDITLADRMAEVRFGMRLHFNKDKADRLRTEIRKEYAGKKNADGVDLSPLAEVRLSNDAIEGMLTGSIDLSLRAGKDARIYIVDWKSNQIPDEVGGYSGPGLVQAMAHSSYHLQYTLYATALCMHLRTCDRNWSPRQFGGVHYIFLRAFGRKDQGGDFFHRPSDTHLKEVTRILTEE